MKKIYYLFMLLFITVACEQSLEQEESLKTPIIETNLAGNWTVSAYIDDNVAFGPFTISTQVTQDNKSLHVKDNGEFWNFQTEAKILDFKNAFEASSALNQISNVETKINILEGSIIKNDSISFDIQFEDDETPYGYTYTISGRRK